jgi:mRNA-degrading endonuclease toxin of MazEF toxin-antitoxin module
MRVPIRKGAVLWLPDDSVNLPPGASRTEHVRRPVLVVSGDANNTDGDWPVFLGCPISSQSYATEFDVRLPAGAGGLAKKGWVRVPLVQPFSKTDVLDRSDQIEANKVDEVIARLLAYMDAIQ